MHDRTGIRYLGLVICIILMELVPVAYAGCGIDTNPYDNIPGPLPNGYYPPAADFSGDPVQGYAPLTVNFIDRSTNVPTNWAWNFGDGLSSNSKNPVHTYQSPGRYTVSLTAGNGYGGNSITKSSYIVVNPASSSPLVDFTANITSGYAPLQVEFTDMSTGGIIVSRTWTFSKNDNPISETTTGPKFAYTFTDAGQYNISLMVTAKDNQSASLEKHYYISVSMPTPEYGTVTLYPGWNLVSTPLPLNEQYRTAGQVFATIDTDSRSIYSYDAGSKQFISLNPGSLILPLEGIWVYSRSQTTLTFNYQVSRPVTISMHMPSGWNLIGYPATEPGSAHDGFASIGSLWSTILCFDPVMQQYSPTIFNEGAGIPGDQQTMYPTRGYWIFMPYEGDLAITIH